MKKLLIMLLFAGTTVFAQKSDHPIRPDVKPTEKLAIPADKNIINVSLNYNLDSKDLRTLYEFENISQSEFNFDGEAVKGKYLVLKIKEFLNGELIKTEKLFDETGNENFKIDTTHTSFKLLTKLDKGELKVWIRGERFGSKKSYFPTMDENGRYVAKDFFGAKKVMKEDANAPFYIMSVITPNRLPNGNGDYCGVAQSEEDPEEFGKIFNIPHYFLIQMEFVE